MNSGAAEFRSVVQFKRGVKNIPKNTTSPQDVENNGGGSDGDDATHTGETDRERVREAEKSMEKSLKTTDIMSWEHLTYHVSVGGGERRRLLNDVSGWVVPGKLTALMGESGAGKVNFPLPSAVSLIAHKLWDSRPLCSTYSLIGPMLE